MFNRRHLRIKVLQILYAFYQSGEKDATKAEKELLLSIEKMYDLYIYLLLTLPELTYAASIKIEEKKKKLRPTDEDLQPNRKFVDNALIKSLSANKNLRALSEKRKVNWQGAENQEIFRKMLIQVTGSEVYFEFMNNGKCSEDDDKLFAIQLFKNEIINSDYLHHFFEESSIHWMDDIDLCCSMVIKALKTWKKQNNYFNILPIFKENDDEKIFVTSLIKETLSRDVESNRLIANLVDNWELERIATMDIIVLKMGITELQICNEIPTKVTLNEYIEISKFYSTPKSNIFVNGILDKAIDSLKKEGKIYKVGRGLLNN
ncbi:MAG: transcription antitermination protein NusB [Bacteroidetes bacterium]|nr:transcription antitermination protein NusB [Bacteroidota bacterium]